MDYIFQGFLKAIELLIAGDAETYSAVLATLKVTTLSIVVSLVIGIPLGFTLGYFNF